MWTAPQIARGVLEFLATTQAKDFSPAQDAEPGKILHEARFGEMAALDEIPFRRYYGSVDSTPLFLMLASAYYQRTGDRGFIESLWPAIELALEWIDRYGDRDGDGFVEYHRRSAKGLIQQGWKDSYDSVFHRDGLLAEGPIALCEVQGYVYAAKRGLAVVADSLDRGDMAEKLRREASVLRTNFNSVFWCDDIGVYALALDGQKRPCMVRTSNAGHCLYTGIAESDKASLVANLLMSDEFFSGWGIRTVGRREIRFNPMSYHNGSIWPHDNALIASGCARYGRRDFAAKILSGMLAAASLTEDLRLPELFCGFPRRPGKAPTSYPVACSPQTWATAAAFQLLEACLGLSVNGLDHKITLTDPTLPLELDRLNICNLSVDDSSVDLKLLRHGERVTVSVIRKAGNIDTVVEQGN
jgi:glycogen debranching enzyme